MTAQCEFDAPPPSPTNFPPSPADIFGVAERSIGTPLRVNILIFLDAGVGGIVKRTRGKQKERRSGQIGNFTKAKQSETDRNWAEFSLCSAFVKKNQQRRGGMGVGWNRILNAAHKKASKQRAREKKHEKQDTSKHISKGVRENDERERRAARTKDPEWN